MSPYKALFRREPPSIIGYEIELVDPISIQETLQERDNMLQQLKFNL